MRVNWKENISKIDCWLFCFVYLWLLDILRKTWDGTNWRVDPPDIRGEFICCVAWVCDGGELWDAFEGLVIVWGNPIRILFGWTGDCCCCCGNGTWLGRGPIGKPGYVFGGIKSKGWNGVTLLNPFDIGEDIWFVLNCWSDCWIARWRIDRGACCSDWNGWDNADSGIIYSANIL